MKKNKGITLIETLIYIALLSLLMAGSLSSAYLLIRREGQQSQTVENDSILILKNYHEK